MVKICEMAPTREYCENVHFLLPLVEMDPNLCSFPTNRDILGHLYKLYIDRPKNQYRLSITAYFSRTIQLVTAIWQQQSRNTLKYNSIRKKMQRLMDKYRSDIKQISRSERNVDYLYNIFDVEKKDSENGIEEAVRKLSMAESVGDVADVSIDPDTTDDEDFVPKESDLDSSGDFESVLVPKHSRNFNIERICTVADRRNISIRVAAFIVSTTLQEIGVITNKNHGLIVDKNKILYSSKKSRAKAAVITEKSPVCLQFDGKSIRNLKMVHTNNTRNKRQIAKNEKHVEHIVILKQPGDVLLGFVVCESATAENIFRKFLSFLNEKGISLDSLAAMSCDGASTNVGNKNGIIRRFEQHLGRPLHWIICMLHLNERTLGNVITLIDGKTTGPSSHSGDIMKVIATSHTRPPVIFEPITFGEMPHKMDDCALTNDQQYLLQIARMVDSGVLDKRVCEKVPGRINNARWLTTASRILREYVATRKPTKNVKLLVRYIMKVYIPLWFQTKIHHSWICGSKHLFRLVNYSRLHVPEIFVHIKQCVLNNNYFAQPESMILTMITDEDMSVRRNGYAKKLSLVIHAKD